MKGLVISTENAFSEVEFGDPLYKTVGDSVGGYIEIVHPMLLPAPYVMILNEDGRRLGLRTNAVGSLLYGSLACGELIVGDVVIMKEGFIDGEPDVIGLEASDVNELMRFVYILFAGLPEPASEGKNDD